MAGDYMTLAEALDYARMAEDDLRESTRLVSTRHVLELVNETDHSAYDCEYVALAQELDVQLVTGDETVADLFSDTAVLLEDFATGRE
jgi:predicted nucleic acid-binding protein